MVLPGEKVSSVFTVLCHDVIDLLCLVKCVLLLASVLRVFKVVPTMLQVIVPGCQKTSARIA